MSSGGAIKPPLLIPITGAESYKFIPSKAANKLDILFPGFNRLFRVFLHHFDCIIGGDIEIGIAGRVEEDKLKIYDRLKY